jgi:hypothetical protein
MHCHVGYLPQVVAQLSLDGGIACEQALCTANALVGDEQFILQLRLACQRCVQVGSQRVHFVLQDERVGSSKMPAQICIHLHGARLAFPKRRQLKRQLANL